MNIYDAVIKDYPYAAYKFLTSTTSYANIMGGSSALTINTPSQSSFSMVTGPTKSMIVGSTVSATIPFPDRFSKEFNRLPFALEIWTGFDTTGAIQILSHSGSTDGLYFDGNFIKFSVDLDGGGSVSVSWPVPTFTKNYHIIGSYNGTKLSLFIDGLVKSEIDMPAGAVLATKTPLSLVSGVTASKVMRIEAPAVYYKALGPDRAAAHYAAGRALMGAEAAVSAYSGSIWKFSDQRRDVLYARDIDWTVDGYGVLVSPGISLEPVYDTTDLSQAGTYTIATPLADNVAGSPPAIQGMKLEWSGDGTFTVQYSLDNGSSWTTAVNGEVQASTVGMAGTVTPQIKITFPSGAVKGANIVRTMRITAYKSLKAYAVNSNERFIALNGLARTSTNWSEPIETDNATGTAFGLSNYGVLNESVETDVVNVGTVEFLLEWSGTITSTYLIDSRSVTPSNASFIWVNGTNFLAYSGFSAVYVNGVSVASGAFTPVVGRAYHIIGVYTTPHNAKIAIGSASASATFTLNEFATYPGSLTASQALALFNSYFGYPILAVEDANTITLQETGTAAKAYANDWSISGAG